MSFAAFRHRVRSTQWSTLTWAWALLTFSGSSMCILMYNVAQRRFMCTDHYKNALNILDEHKDAKQLLGEPVHVGKMNMFDKQRNHMRRTESMFRIPLCGTHSSGFMDVLANKNADEAIFTTQRLVLELDDGNRFLMFDRSSVLEEEEEQRRRKGLEAKQRQKRPRGR